MTRMFSPLISILIAASAVVALDTPARAQPAAAIGKPLPEGNLAVGTISVRVVAGGPSSPVVGTEVAMLVNGQPRTARTDAAGRATFAGLPVGAMVQAKIVDENKQEIASETFPVPAQGGARLMLSTKPFTGTGGMPAPAEALGGMPEPRQMSGQPQPDRMAGPGSYNVRVTYNELVVKDGRIVDPNPPVGHPVALAAYSADDTVKVLTSKTDAEGLARFEGLDQSGATSYFAMTMLPRGTSTDRLIAVSAIPDGQGGMRVVLSGDKRDATTPAIDDYGKLIPRDGREVPAGKVRITLDGVPQPGLPVTLYDATTSKPVGVANTVQGAPDPKQVRGSANFNPSATPAGALEVVIKGGMGAATDPLAGIEIRLVSADGDQPIAGAVATTGADGKVNIVVPPSSPALAAVKAVMVINGKDMVSAGMDLSAAGGTLDIVAQWPSQGRPEAVFDLAHTTGQVLFAQYTFQGQQFRSLPFQTAPEAGAHSNIYVYPRTLFSFDTHSFVEDQLLAVQGTFEITNYAWAPYRAGADGLLIKLPKRHKGAIVAPQDQNDVAVAQGEGFRLLRPIPPGGRKFRMGYSMPIERGEVEWAFELPMGAWQSEMKIRQTPGMTVKLPADIKGQTQTAATGEPWFVIPAIMKERGQTLSITFSGFPTEPAWKIWMPRIVGVLVLGMILGGIGLALTRSKASPAADREAERTKLLDELVALEKRGVSSSKERQRRDQLIDELERLWGAAGPG